MIINDTKIQYIRISDKIYKVTSISWLHMTLGAKETDLTVGDVPEEEVFPIEDFDEFKIRLVNRGGKAEIADIAEWKKKHNI